MRDAESQYWDKVCQRLKTDANGNIIDNVRKRCEIVRRILAHRPFDARVLEIGVGHALTAHVVNSTLLGNLYYVGTDVSPEFCKAVQQKFRLSVVNTDIMALPTADGGFHMVWAFDTLEHVRPEDRAAGYAEIARVLAPDGIVMLNLPLNESGHAEEFDWGITDQDVAELAKAIGGRVGKWEVYDIPEIERSYAWVEITRWT